MSVKTSFIYSELNMVNVRVYNAKFMSVNGFGEFEVLGTHNFAEAQFLNTRSFGCTF